MDPMGYNDQATDTTSASQGFNECTRVLSKQKKNMMLDDGCEQQICFKVKGKSMFSVENIAS